MRTTFIESELFDMWAKKNIKRENVAFQLDRLLRYMNGREKECYAKEIQALS